VDRVSEAPASVEFGRFRILPQRREVLADGRPIELGGRAFDVLMALIEANGRVVSKDTGRAGPLKRAICARRSRRCARRLPIAI
jgi:hypothetical protein